MVFYALAVRHDALKSVIYLAEIGHEPLIDILPDEIVFYDEKDMETMKDAREKFDEAMSKVEEGGAGLYSPFFGIMGGGATSEETNADQRDKVLKMFRILGASLDEIKMALGRIQSPSIEGEEQINSRGVGLPQIELWDW